MKPTKKNLLSSTGIAVALVAGALAVGTGAAGTDRILPAFVLAAAACEPCAACAPCDPCAPCAACGPCDPCAAAPAAATGCYVPRLQEASANPCAIENPCAAEAACDPCAAANPCAVDNPCAAAMACDPCSPLNLTGAERVAAVQEELNKRGFDAGSVDGIVGPQTARAIEAAEMEFGLTSTGEITTDLMMALFAGTVMMACAACAPCAACEPCAACGPCELCEPCAACAPCEAAMPCAACGPCEPCGPCGPCDPCGPCGPCEAAAVTDVTEEELQTVYECLLENMRTAYGDDWMEAPSDFARRFPVIQVAYSDSELDEAREFVEWLNVATAPYASATHGGRFVTNHVNDVGEEAYRRYEEIGEMPVGGIVAKPSFTIGEDGEAQLGPLFLMEKMDAGFYEPSDDWKYTMVMPDGSIAGITQGQNSQNVESCIACHMAAPDGQDSLLFLPEHLRR